MNYRMQFCQGIGEINQDQWNSLLRANHGGALHPALRHEFLCALEDTGCASHQSGWQPLHIALTDSNGELVGACPMYIKSHSYGEYVFDWQWAQAYGRHGLSYYPKLLVAIPFTPVKACKWLATDLLTRTTMLRGLLQWLRESAPEGEPVFSSMHSLFLTQQEIEAFSLLSTDITTHESDGPSTDQFLARQAVQFHWRNRNKETDTRYVSFDEFLDSLEQKKRKNIRAERRKVRESGVSVYQVLGNAITEEELSFFYTCYCQTYLEHHSTPYLNLEFFQQIIRTMPEQIVFFFARRAIPGNHKSKLVAASMLIFSESHLYGRYWGCIESLPALHFELCYYSPLAWAIEQGLDIFEGGAQGEHKLARGFDPVQMESRHWIRQADFRQAIARFLDRETTHLEDYRAELQAHSAFKADHSN